MSERDVRLREMAAQPTDLHAWTQAAYPLAQRIVETEPEWPWWVLGGADFPLIAASVNAMRVALPLIAETLGRHRPRPRQCESCLDAVGYCPDFRAAAAMLHAFVQHHPDCPPGYQEAAR